MASSKPWMGLTEAQLGHLGSVRKASTICAIFLCSGTGTEVDLVVSRHAMHLPHVDTKLDSGALSCFDRLAGHPLVEPTGAVASMPLEVRARVESDRLRLAGPICVLAAVSRPLHGLLTLVPHSLLIVPNREQSKTNEVNRPPLLHWKLRVWSLARTKSRPKTLSFTQGAAGSSFHRIKGDDVSRHLLTIFETSTKKTRRQLAVESTVYLNRAIPSNTNDPNGDQP